MSVLSAADTTFAETLVVSNSHFGPHKTPSSTKSSYVFPVAISVAAAIAWLKISSACNSAAVLGHPFGQLIKILTERPVEPDGLIELLLIKPYVFASALNTISPTYLSYAD